MIEQLHWAVVIFCTSHVKVRDKEVVTHAHHN